MTERVKKILLGFIFVVLLLPLVNDKLNLIHTDGLRGYFSNSGDVAFSADKWIDGSYQEAKSKYINDNVSFRPDLIRLNCQLAYSLYEKTRTGWGIFANNNCIIDDQYIHAWNGYDFSGYDTLRTKMVKLKALQDTFAKLGKSLVLVHAASKGYFYADCIPERFIPEKKRPTNFATCLHLGDSLGINQVDFNSWFCAMRDTSKELLYSKQGIHWSIYGGMIAADSLISYIEHLRHIRMPHIRWHNFVHTSKPRYPDNDLAAAMNLIWPFVSETFTYADGTCDNDSTKTRPSAIYIGDSFIWTLLDNRTFDCINSKWEFWFYMKEVYTKVSTPREPKPMDNYDWLGAINNTDYIVLLYTAPNLKELGNGLIETAYAHYFPGK